MYFLKNKMGSDEKDRAGIKKILLVGDANGYFRIDYARNMKQERFQMDILSFTFCKPENRKFYKDVIECVRKTGNSKILTIKYYIDFFLCLLKLPQYDIIHIHSVKVIYSIFSFLFRRKCIFLISSIYGSDIYRVSKGDRFLLHGLFNRSRYITVESDDMKKDFLRFFGERYVDRIAKVPFGVTQLNYIEEAKERIDKIKRELHVPNDKLVLTIGYNATIEQHHLEIMRMLKSESRFSDLFVIIPLSYGDKRYKEKVVRFFDESELQGLCFCDFWPIEDVCKLRVISDIMIQVQDTDAFSTSMIEYLYSENVIITGAWLPYSIISDYINVVDNLDSIPTMLLDVIQNIHHYKAKSSNAIDFIKRNYSWNYLKPKWAQLYD